LLKLDRLSNTAKYKGTETFKSHILIYKAPVWYLWISLKKARVSGLVWTPWFVTPVRSSGHQVNEVRCPGHPAVHKRPVNLDFPVQMSAVLRLGSPHWD
jgi:hypothetical protein